MTVLPYLILGFDFIVAAIVFFVLMRRGNLIMAIFLAVMIIGSGAMFAFMLSRMNSGG